MKTKRILIALLIMMLFVCPMTAFGADDYVYDDYGYLDDVDILNACAGEIEDTAGLAVYTLITEDVSTDEMENYLYETVPEGDVVVLLVLPHESMFMIYGDGEGLNLIRDEDTYNILCDAYNLPDTYQDGVQQFYDTIAYLYHVTDEVPDIYVTGADKPKPIPDHDGDFVPVERTLPLVVDFAGVLRDADKTYLNGIANDIARKYPYEIAVAFVDTLDGMDVMDYADDFYDYNGYGAGENDDGFLLLICPNSRDYWMTTCGLGEEMFDERRMEDIDDIVVSYLRENDWAGAAAAFLTESEKCLEAGMPEPPRPGIAALIVTLLAGLCLGSVPVAGMEKRMKSVQAQNRADDSIKGGLNLTNTYDRYITTHVHHRKIETSGSSGSRSSGSHTSSSGRSHSGRGGKF